MSRTITSPKRPMRGRWLSLQTSCLQQRCIAKGATVIGTTGKPFTEASIGSAVAMRNLMADLREQGDIGGGPAPFAKADRSRFLSSLHEALEQLKRQHR